MTKEMTVAEIAKALGYEIKVVKEQPKPVVYQFEAGDVAKFDEEIRIIVQIEGGLSAVDIYGDKRCTTGSVQKCGYEKIGELQDYIN